MNKQLNKIVSFLAIYLIVFSTFLPAFTAANTESPSLANGEYTINFDVLKDGTNEVSVMDTYTEKPAKLFVDNGQNKVHLTLTHSDWIKEFKVEKAGEFVDAVVVDEKEEAKKRVIEFEVPNLAEKLNAKTHVVITGIPGFNYDNRYTVQIQFDTDSLVEINVPEPPPADPGTEEPPANPEKPPANPEQPDDPNNPEQPIVDLIDGKDYTIHYTALHATKEEPSSAMDGRFAKPATIKVREGKTLISFVLENKQHVTGLELETAPGHWVEVTENYEFIDVELADLAEILYAKVSMEVPMQNGTVYKNTQSFRIAFDRTTIQEKEAPIEEPPVEEQPPGTIADGEYTVDFIILKDQTEEASVMDSYTEKPALLLVDNGENIVHLTLKNSDWIKVFKVEKNGEFVDAEVIETDEAANTRVVKFELPNIGEKLNAFTHVKITDMPGFNYDNEYTVQLKFEPSSLKEVEIPELVIELDENGQKELTNIDKNTLIQTTFGNTPISVIVPPGSTSLSVADLESTDHSLVVKISVGNLGDQKVTLTLPKPIGVPAEKIGAYHQNGEIWENREAKVEGNNVVFETNLSAVKIAEKVEVPQNLTQSVSGNQVTLSWNEVAGASYELVRVQNGTETIIPNITATTFTNTVDYASNYTYKVRAIKENHQSAWSNSISVTTGSNPNTGGSTPTPGERADGDYSISYRVLKDGTNETSIMQEYTVIPAKLTVQGGKNYISITLRNSSWVPVFQVTNNGGTASVISSDSSADTRVVRFEVYDLSQKVNVYTEANVPAINYSGKYNVQIQFNPSSISSGYSQGPVTSNPIIPVVPTETTINPANGGKIEYNGAVIEFPQGVFASDIKITVERVSTTANLPMNEKSKLISDVLEIKKDKDGSFSKAVTITIPYDKSKVDLSKYDLGIFWLNEQTKKWIQLENVKVDTVNGKVSGEVDHFTKFAVLAMEKEKVEKEKAKLHFSDIKGHWAEQYIETLIELGAVNGYANGEFKPNNQITRAEFASMLVKAFNLETKNGKVFNDTSKHWAKDVIATAAAAGIVTGYDENTFGPNDLITREQMALMIIRATKITENNTALSFSDANQIADWALASVKAAVEKEIITGYPNKTFRPKGNATRAEAVTIVVKALHAK